MTTKEEKKAPTIEEANAAAKAAKGTPEKAPELKEAVMEEERPAQKKSEYEVLSNLKCNGNLYAPGDKFSEAAHVDELLEAGVIK